MTDRVGTALEVVALLFVGALVAGQVLGQPVLLGFVTTGSMEPTLNPGDGFVAIPAAVAGPVEDGDVITFRAEEIQGGGLTTHRVVEETDRGYVTKGDANPFTDQDGDEPPVKDAQVVATAWQPGGSVLVIPHLGTAVTGARTVLATVQRQLAALLGTRSLLGVQGLAYILFALSAIAYLLDVWLSDDRRRRDRDRSRETGTSARLLIAVFAAAVVLAATAAMVVPAGPQQFGVVSAEFDSPGPRVIETGTSESVRYVVGNGGLVPVTVFFEPATDGVDVEPREMQLEPRSRVNATLTLSAPPETGYYRQYLVEHRYLTLLPPGTIRALYAIHPWLPIVVIDALLGGAFYLFGVAVVGTGRIRSRSRAGPSRGIRGWFG